MNSPVFLGLTYRFPLFWTSIATFPSPWQRTHSKTTSHCPTVVEHMRVCRKKLLVGRNCSLYLITHNAQHRNEHTSPPKATLPGALVSSPSPALCTTLLRKARLMLCWHKRTNSLLLVGPWASTIPQTITTPTPSNSPQSSKNLI